jgi:hypothetical protein
MPTPRRPTDRATPRRSRPIALPLLLVILALLPEGCVTAAVWDRLDHSRGERIAAVALTPVTVALDAALIAGEVCVNSGQEGWGRGWGRGCGCRCR